MNVHLIKYLQKNYSKATAKSYEREIEIYIVNNPNAEQYKYAEVIKYIGVIRKKYTNKNTVKRLVASIKVFYNYLCFTKIREDNPTTSIQLKDTTSKDIQLQDLFTSTELECLLLAKSERYKALENRNRLIVSLLIYQALKPTEIAKLKLTDINHKTSTISVKASPKNNQRKLVLKENQIQILNNYLEENRNELLKNKQSNFLIIGHRAEAMTAEDITKHIKRNYGKMYLPRKLNCQTIRQSVITNLLKQHHDLRIVQSFAGHKYPSSTEKYKQSNVDELQFALNKYHPMK
jgi:integrase/recombinase XerD